MKDKLFLILGGDNRALYLGEYLEKEGHKVCYFAFNETDCFTNLNDAINEADIIILPLPLSKDRVTLNAPLFDETVLLSEISALATSDKLIFGGQLSKSFCEELNSKSVFYCDYLLLDELAIYNAVPTAEGVAGILINELPVTIHGMHVAVTGYGKVGKIIAATLHSMGAAVTVFARKERDLADAHSRGFTARKISSLSTEYNDFDALINTIPIKIIGEKEIKKLNPDCVLIETASAPFGIDFQCAKENAFQIIKASSLPGKVAPKTAGGIIGRSILPIISEKRGSI